MVPAERLRVWLKISLKIFLDVMRLEDPMGFHTEK
jgi:hypothetical protein